MATDSLLNSEMLDSYRELASSDDPNFFKTYLSTFLNGVQNYVAGIESAIVNGDADSLTRAAHALKSSCMNVGAEAIVDRSAKLEALGKTGSVAGAAILASEVAVLCLRMAEEIHALPEFCTGGS